MDLYRIEPNSAGRKVLIIQDYFDVRDEKVNELDFDLIYFDLAHVHYNLVREMVSQTSPFVHRKFRMMPRFMSMLHFGHFERFGALIDGFSPSAFDNSVTQRAEEIIFQIEKLGAHNFYAQDMDENELFRRMCVFCFTRQDLSFTNTTIPTLRSGLSAVFAAYVLVRRMVGNDPNPDDSNIRAITNKFLEMEYITPTKFVERIHLCQMCGSDHLLFTECCNKCKSSNLKEEDMIHHFRCANISKESDYLFDDELRCPKCKRQLRHIGIDYDRPSKVQTCNECGAVQLHSEMKVICSKCGHHMQPLDLKPYDIYEYTFTPHGIRELCEHARL